MNKHINVKTIDNNTVHVGSNITTWLEPDILSVTIKGDQSDELADMQQRICIEMAERVSGKINYLIDLNLAGNNSHHARKIWQILTESEKTNKVAVFGIHPVARVLAAFVMGVSSKKEMLFLKPKKKQCIGLNLKI